MAFDKLHWYLSLASQGLSEEDSRFCLFGSSVMYLYGLREEIGDVDVFVTVPLWERLVNDGGWRVEVPRVEDPPIAEGCFSDLPPIHAFYAWKQRGHPIDVPALLNTDIYVEDWPVQPLGLLAEWKKTIKHHDTRPNDEHDIQKIEDFLATGVRA